MSYSVLSIPPFDRQIKRLNRKYPSLKEEYLALIEVLEKNPFQGVSLGKNCFKIRLNISSKGKGKSGGARVITHILIKELTVYLLAIYDKSDKSTLNDQELEDLLQFILD